MRGDPGHGDFFSFAFFDRIMLSSLKCDRNIRPYRAAGCDFDSRALCTFNPARTLQTKSVQWDVAGGSVLFNDGAPQFWRPPAASCCISVWRGKETFCSATESRVSNILLLSHFVHYSLCQNFPAAVLSNGKCFSFKKEKICGEKKNCFPWDWKKKSVPTFNTMFPALYVHRINNTVHRRPLVLHRWCKGMQVGFFYG